MILKFDKKYWEANYTNGTTGWNIGEISTPIKEYINQLSDKNSSILIPGAGNAYEAEYLYTKGFNNVFILDIAHNPLQNFKYRNPSFPDSHLLEEDFFEHNKTYDLIIEQTFFCALHPSQRTNYAKRMHSLLTKGGKLVGLLFNFPLTNEGPPFGGSYEEYQKIFEPYFDLLTLEKCHNSIKPRANREFFIILKKKQL
ncbi:MAG: SAM-dependent methyltransferase [Bacteroidetes bacterium]|nr:SAM-dependent methyltransferase [Bacteroidota bacterium]